MPTPPDKVGEYTIEQELGRGGMGVVQLAHHPRHGEVALKRLLDKPHAFALRSLRTEIHLLSALDHPGVVRLIDHGIEERGPWMAMEHVSGRPLSDYLHALGQEGTAGLHTSRHGLGLSTTAEQQSTAALTEEQQHTVALTAEQDLKRPTASEQYTAALHAASTLPASEQRPLAIPRPALEPVSKAQVAQWIYQVCQALAYIHGQGIVHADVKPGNILIDTSGRPVLVDFGIATRFGSRVEVDTMRRAGVLAGSLSTISPEQCRGASLDARTDLYAIGCVLFELLAGRPPFVLQDGEPSTALMDKHMHQAPP
ncbi:MAG: serine/threonine-protein kinase, partial [Myxococcota bacterium]